MSKVDNGSVPRFRVPPRQLSLSFSDLQFETTKGKVILQNVTGFIPAGEMCGLLGPSGSGKTCLLDVLAMRKKRGGILKEGKVLYGGKPLKPHLKGNSVCYVGQEDVLLPSFTVRETVTYAVRLEYGYSMSRLTVKRLVDGIMEDVGLMSSANVLVGNPISGKGISGGQRRRLMIGVELVACPAVMILDEPTSGLDFASAFGVMKELQHLAKIGHTVLTVIHQPSSQIWSLFDRVGFICKGSLVYFGTPDKLLPYFESLGHMCPEFYNPAEFVMELLNPSSEAEVSDTDSLLQAFQKSPTLSDMRAHMEEEVQTRSREASKEVAANLVFKIENGDEIAETIDVPSSPSESDKPWFISKAAVLLHRNLLDLYRNPSILLIRLFLASLTCVLIGLTFLRVGDRFTDEAIRSRSSALFFIPSFTCLISLSAIPYYMNTKALVKKEIGNGRYSVWTFASSLLVPALISATGMAICVCLISFYMLGFRNFGEYFMAMFSFFLMVEALVLAVAAVVPHYLIGMLLVLAIVCAGMAVEGYFIVFDRVNVSVRWIGYITPNRYMFRALMRNEFETMGNLTSIFYPTGRDYLDFFGYYGHEAFESFWIDVAILYSFIFGFSLAFLIGLQTWRS